MDEQYPLPVSTGREASVLLNWYDNHARDLPWRLRPGSNRVADPYRVWLSEIMLQQTTVAAVKAYFERFMARWPDVDALARAEDSAVMAEWAGLGYYARARNMLKAARIVAFERGGVFPDTEDQLRTLPGIGPYTAAAIAAIAFGRRAVVVDGNVERVMSRYFRVVTPLPDSKPILRSAMDTLTPDLRSGDFAQAVMDLGATICTPRNPSCLLCPWETNCAGKDIAPTLPAKRAKAKRPERYAHAVVTSDGRHVAMAARPTRGLLGGMMSVPLSEITDARQPPPPGADGARRAGEVTHVFTHFRITVEVWRVAGPPTENAMPIAEARDAAPTLIRKILDCALADAA